MAEAGYVRPVYKCLPSSLLNRIHKFRAFDGIHVIFIAHVQLLATTQPPIAQQTGTTQTLHMNLLIRSLVDCFKETTDELLSIYSS